MLLLGVEPNLRWPTFCDDVISVARATGCEMVVTLGALLGDVPHSRPMRCTGSATDEVLAARLGMERSRYEGPTGIVGVLHDAARRVGFASASIWAPVPHYVATAPNPKATLALLTRLATLLDVGLELTDLEIAATAWERSVDEVVAGDADASSYVERLEHRYDETAERSGDASDEASADERRRLARRGRPAVGRVARRRLRALPTRAGRRVTILARPASRAGRGRGRPRAWSRARATRCRRARRCRGTCWRSRRTRACG